MAKIKQYFQPSPTDLSGLIQDPGPLLFLDTARPDSDHHHSYFFSRPKSIVAAYAYKEIPALLDMLFTWSGKGWIAGYLTYEAGYALEPRLLSIAPRLQSKTPLAWFGLFKDPLIFDHSTGRWNRRMICKTGPGDSPVDKINLSFKTTSARYAKNIRLIKGCIARGETYQVNYSFDVLIRSALHDWEMYCQLRQNQQVPFSAFLRIDNLCAASFSPELFFRTRGRIIETKPMKGTAPRGLWAEQDQRIREQLATDPKNRAENVMIVDLLRNDLGRICTTGSIKVKRLFDVETHPTLHQMTSTITGTLRKQTSVGQIMQALFPCGSVTGAPKIHTMEIIRSLEEGQRGIYCGAIGCIAPNGDMTFSVPIRTLQKKGASIWKYRVGSGIVADSQAADEWQECKTKTAFLTQKTQTFEIIESLLWRNGLLFCKEHCSRMEYSAAYFGYPCDKRALLNLIGTIKKQLANSGPQKVRILLSKRGDLSWEHSPLGETSDNSVNIVTIDQNPIDENNKFLYHKTTYRPWYARAMTRIAEGKVYDVLFVNSLGQITEGARTNVFIKKNGILLTPPIGCGLLPGILRQRLLKTGKCKEAIIKENDLCKAEQIFCGNSVRGLIRVQLRDRSV